MKTIEINLYQFNELSIDAKEKAINSLSDINVIGSWYESTYEDAKRIDLEITSFDLDRNLHAKGKFITSAGECAELIIQEHGKECNTHKLAVKFLKDEQIIEDRFEAEIEDDDFNVERDAYLTDLEDEFLKDILQEYAFILQKECEYLTGEAQIIETINANEYYFTEDGKLY